MLKPLGERLALAVEKREVRDGAEEHSGKRSV